MLWLSERMLREIFKAAYLFKEDCTMKDTIYTNLSVLSALFVLINTQINSQSLVGSALRYLVQGEERDIEFLGDFEDVLRDENLKT